MQIRRKNIYKSCVILSMLSVCVPSFVFAQNNDKDAVTELKPIVIKGKKIEDTLDSVNVMTSRQTAKDINEKQVSDAYDVHRLDPSIIYDANKGSFMLRGLEADRVLTTMDGITLPFVSDIIRGNSGNTTFDFGALSTLDITPGSDSSLYGSGALGGLISLRTLNPEDLITEEKNWGSLMKGGYNSVDSSWRVNQAFAVRKGHTYLLFQGSYTEGHERKNMGTVDGYEERTRKNPAQYDQNNLLFKLHQYFGSDHRFGFSAERFNSNRDTHSLNASARYAPGSVHDQDNKRRERLSLSYDYNGDEDTLLDAFRGQLYWQRQSNNHIVKGFRVKAPKGDYSRDNLIRSTSYGFNASALKAFDIDPVHHTLKLAANVSESQFHHYISGKDSCHLKENAFACAFLISNRSDSPDTKSYSVGFAIEDEIGLGDNRFRITPGVRYDWYKHIPQKTPAYEKALISKPFPPEKSGSRFSPKVRAEWDVRDQVTFYAQWARAFRAPSSAELYVSYDKPGLYYVRGNPDLQPETSNGYDIGVRYGDVNFGGSASAFVNQYKNFIDTIDRGPSEEFAFVRQHYINRSRVKIWGVETKVRLALKDGLHSNFALSYSQGKDLDKDEYLNSIPPLKAIIGVGYDRNDWGLDVVLTVAAKRDKVAEGSDYQKIPGYRVFDVSSWWKPFGEAGPIVRAGVYNLFNTKYWDLSDLPPGSNTPQRNHYKPKDYYSQPGRNFKVSFVQKF